MVVDKVKVEKQAKEVLDKFAKALEKSSLEKTSEKTEKAGKEELESYVDREDFERIEGKGNECTPGFKEKILKNAPNHDEDFVIGERGGWK